MRKSFAFVFIGMILLSSLSMFDTTSQDSTKAHSLAYAPHAPILIDGDSGFTNASGVIWGSGTASDPYIIGGWNISGADESGITIMDATAHFVVRDCFVQVGTFCYGIYLERCSNGMLINNSCSNDVYGIYLEISSNVTLAANTLIGNGIWIYGHSVSEWNTFMMNTSNTVNGKPVYYFKNQSGLTVPSGAGQIILANCTDFTIEDQTLNDTTYGIQLGFSSDTLIANNSCSNNWCGIYLYSSAMNTLINNDCSNNYRSGILLESSSYNALRDNHCSSNNGTGIWLAYDYDGNFLNSSNNNTLAGNNCSNNHDGIFLDLSANSSLINNICSSNNNDGIFIEANRSSGVHAENSIIRNRICNNSCGIEIAQGSGNYIWNNTFIGNNGATDTYNSSHVQAFDGGKNNWWNSSNGYGNYWSDWTKPDNNAPSGRVDSPYNIDGGAKAKDYYPLTAPRISDPPYTLPPSDTLIPILAIAVVIIAAVILVSFIFLRKRKGKTAEPPRVNQ